MKSLTLQTQLVEIDKIRAFLKKCLEDCRVSEDLFYWMELSIVEMCINVIRYAYPGSKGEFSVTFWNEGATIYIEIRDRGIPFNPQEAKEPDLDEIIRTRRKGGFGIHLARKLMDGFEYRRENDQNILVMSKNLSC